MSEVDKACWRCSRECLPLGSGHVTGACYQGENEQGIPEVACWDDQEFLGYVPVLLERCPKHIKDIEMEEMKKEFNPGEFLKRKVS